jgi:hypothetical protein
MTENGSSGIVAVPEQGQNQGTITRWGDNLNKKQKSTVRIGFNNINGFKAEINNSNNRDLHSFISHYGFDVFGMSEINLHWKNCQHHVSECTKGWFRRLNYTNAYYKTYPSQSTFQVGGVMQFIIGDTSTRVFAKGGDDIGRWTWQSLRGKNNKVVRFISAYRPVKNEGNAGSTWNQQQYYADIKNSKLNPHEQWIFDLRILIEQWLMEGDSIVLMVDLNDDVRTSQVATSMVRMGLKEIVTSKHQAPNTHQRGSRPIDGIFVSEEICPMACGYVESPSDHLCVWMDLDFESIFGDLHKTGKLQIRRLQCADPRTVQAYNNALWESAKEKNIERMILDLDNPRLNHKEKVKLWEKIDKTMLKLRLNAEKKCRQIKAGNIQWTPELAKLRLIKKFWTLEYRRRSKYRIDFKFFSRVARKVGLDPKHCWEMGEIHDNIRKAKNDLSTYKKLHAQKRGTWLEGLAQALADNEESGTQDKDITTMKYITMLKQREEQRSSARIIRRIVHSSKAFQQLDHVDFDVDGVVRTTDTKENMERVLLTENAARFNQAGNSPFLQPPLAQVVGHYADNNALEVLSNTTAPIVTNDFYTNLVLQAIDHPNIVHPIQVEMSSSSFAQGWLKCREHTAAGPSGLHFGHFMAACKHPQMREIECSMANFPLRSGYSPERWQHGVEVMLLKQFNNFHVSKLRAILLFEADFNFNNKRIGRSLMWQAEDMGWLAPEQYGSRRSHSAIDHCLNKRLSFDLLRQYRQSGAICVNDMKGCYDRIVHSVAALCMQRWGMPKAPIRMMLHTIQHLKHYVRTAFGKSDSYFEANKVHPVAIQGIGQGNGAGPQIWAAISTLLLDILRKQQMGGYFISPITQKQLHLVGYAYVDDTDIITTDNEQNYIHTTNNIQQCIDTWQGIIHATGGQLEPAKTYWYLINFTWTKGKWRYSTIPETPMQLTMNNNSSSPIRLERLEVTEARRTLGVRLAPDGNNQAEFKYLREECNQWADRIWSGMVPRKYAWQAFSSTIWAKVAYALPATTFSQQQCQESTKRMVAATLSKMGINKNIPRDLVFGSKNKQGLGFPDLYVWQGTEAVNRFLKYMSSGSSATAHLLKASYELLVLESGLDQPLSYAYKQWKTCITDSFLSHLWQFIDTYQIRLRGPSTLGNGHRMNDRLIMDSLVHKLSDEQLARVNRCRLYLQVVWWSDITDGSGTAISENAILGRQQAIVARHWKWPKQERPPQQDWETWIMAISLGNVRLRNGKIKLGHPLGHWFDGNYTWYYDSSCERLLHAPTNSIWIRQTGRPTRSATSKYKQSTVTDGQFPKSQVASITTSANTVIVEGFAPVRPPIINNYSSFRSFLRSHDKWHWLQNVEVTENVVVEVARHIQEGNGIVVSDGSFKDGKGTASLVIEGHNSNARIVADVLVPGNSDEQRAFRSEAAGILASFQLVNAIVLYTKISQGSIKMCCDGKSALSRCFEKRIDMRKPHWDIVTTAIKERESSVIIWSPQHVKGHQNIFPLERDATLNDEMDQRCKNFWNVSVQSQPIWFQQSWTITIQDRQIGNDVSEEIRQHCATERATKYWKQYLGDHQDAIDWEPLGSAIKNIKRSRAQWLTKHSSGFCSVGSFAKKIGLRSSDMCPRCGEVETVEHVWRCKHEEAAKLWRTHIRKLQRTLGQLQTDPKIIKAIITGLDGWHQGEEKIYNRRFVAEQAADLQSNIGWKHFFEGRQIRQWRTLQEEYFRRKSICTSGKRWSRAIILKLWDIAWDLWEHRNGIAHGKDSILLSIDINNKIKELWKNPIRN